MKELLVYHEPTAKQRDILYREPDARDIFTTLSPPVQDYLHLTWQKASPLLSREERKTLSAQASHLATELFGQQNIDKGYNRELQRYTDAVWLEVWAGSEERQGQDLGK